MFPKAPKGLALTPLRLSIFVLLFISLAAASTINNPYSYNLLEAPSLSVNISNATSNNTNFCGGIPCNETWLTDGSRGAATGNWNLSLNSLYFGNEDARIVSTSTDRLRFDGGDNVIEFFDTNELFFIPEFSGVDETFQIEFFNPNAIGTLFIRNDAPGGFANLEVQNNVTIEEDLEVVNNALFRGNLTFQTERPWFFRQASTGPNTKLALQSSSDSKNFEIKDSTGTTFAVFRGSSTGSKVGIGPDEFPDADLDVQGNMKIDDDLLIGEDLIISNVSQNWTIGGRLSKIIPAINSENMIIETNNFIDLVTDGVVNFRIGDFTGGQNYNFLNLNMTERNITDVDFYFGSGEFLTDLPAPDLSAYRLRSNYTFPQETFFENSISVNHIVEVERSGVTATFSQPNIFGPSTLIHATTGFMQIAIDNTVLLFDENKLTFGAPGAPNLDFLLNDLTINSGNVLGQIDFDGQDTGFRTGARVVARASNVWGTNLNDAPTDLEWFVQSDGNSNNINTLRMELKETGNFFVYYDFHLRFGDLFMDSDVKGLLIGDLQDVKIGFDGTDLITELLIGSTAKDIHEGFAEYKFDNNINITNNTLMDIYSLNFSNGDSITGSSSIHVNTNNSFFVTDNFTGGVKMFTNLPRAEFDAMQSQEMGLIPFSNSVSGFTGDVVNTDNIDNQSRFIEQNLNNGSNASAGFVARNNEGHEVTFGIGSGNFSFGGTNFYNEAAILNSGPEKFNFANGFKKGWNWRSNVFGSFIESMQLSYDGNLSILGLFTSNDVFSLGLFDRIDNVTEIDSNVEHSTTLPVLYAVDTTNNEVTINITFGTNSSFQVWDAKKKFKSNSAFVNILSSDGLSIDHSVELKKKDKAYQFYFNGLFWYYGEIGKGEFEEISSSHDDITDFGNLIEDNDAYTERTINGNVTLDNLTINRVVINSMVGTYVGGSAYLCIWDNASIYSSEVGC